MQGINILNRRPAQKKFFSRWSFGLTLFGAEIFFENFAVTY